MLLSLWWSSSRSPHQVLLLPDGVLEDAAGFPQDLLAGWWYTYPSEKYEFVSWDYDIPNWMESHKIPCFQTTNQPCLDMVKLLVSPWQPPIFCR